LLSPSHTSYPPVRSIEKLDCQSSNSFWVFFVDEELGVGNLSKASAVMELRDHAFSNSDWKDRVILSPHQEHWTLDLRMA
jgi:hypothetical protein